MLYFELLELKTAKRMLPGLGALVVLAGLTAPGALASEQVAIAGEVNVIADGEGEVVAIGGEVSVSGEAIEKLVAIGGTVQVDIQSEDEAVIIGGEVEIRGTYAGELVGVGGVVDYYGANAEEVVLFGGEVTVHEEAVSGGRAIAFGGDVKLEGRFAKTGEFGGGHVTASGQFADAVMISAREVDIDGAFYGDLMIEGQTIRINEGATITGHLTVRSPDKPQIHESLDLQNGSYTYEYIEKYDPKIGNFALSDIIDILMAAFAVLIAIVCATALIAFITVVAAGRVTTNAAIALRQTPGKSSLIGLVTVFITGAIGIFFLIILIGPLLPLLIGLIGFFTVAYFLSVMMFNKVGEPVSTGVRFGYTALGTIVLLALNLIPVLGTIVVVIISIIGAGAFILALFNAVPEMDAFTGEAGDDQGHFQDEFKKGERISAKGNDTPEDTDDLDASEEDDKT